MADSTKSRESIISTFSNQIFSAMLQEVLMDAVLQSHKDLMHSKCMCTKCGTNCGSSCGLKPDKPLEAPEENAQVASSITDLIPPNHPNHANVSGTTTPMSKDGNIYFECTVCQKKVASNRYAPHLSGCLGLDSRARRGAARNAITKNKLNADNDRSGSPGTFSDRPSPSVDPPNGKVKPKSKSAKKSNGNAKDSIEMNSLKRSPDSMDPSPAKKTKKPKTGFKTNNDASGNDKKLSLSVLSKQPNKGTTPASPSARSGSQYSGRESPAASATHSVSVSSLTGHSPNGFVKPSAMRRPSKPGSAEQIAKKLQTQQQMSLSSACESLAKPKPPEKEEGLIGLSFGSMFFKEISYISVNGADVDGEELEDSSSSVTHDV